MPDQNLNPFLLAANVPEPDHRLLPLLRSDGSLASKQDSHGYSLLHAAASYNHVNLLRSLIREFGVDVDLVDEDGETCLFVAETVELAACLVEELQINTAIKNHEGLNAAEKIESEEDFPEVAAYLLQHSTGAPTTATTNGSVSSDGDRGMRHPPPLPPNMNITIDTASTEHLDDASGQAPDPEFRRRIEELAAREDFDTEQGQRELRNLITDAVRGVSHEDRDVRRKVE